MPNFIVNKNTDNQGDHEVHDMSQDCGHLPDWENRVSLGYHATCKGAVQQANRDGYSPANGCFYCAKDCHTT